MEIQPFYDYNWNEPIRVLINGKWKEYNPITNKFVDRLRSDKYQDWLNAGKPLFKSYIPSLLDNNVLERKLKIVKVIKKLPEVYVNINTDSVRMFELHFIFYYIFKFGYKKNKQGYVQVNAESLKKYLGKSYNHAISILFNWKYIETFTGNLNDGYQNRKEGKGYSKGFRINPNLIPDSSLGKLKILPPYNSLHLQLKLYKKAIKNQKNLKIKQTHQSLVIMADYVMIDESAFLHDVNSNPEKYLKKNIDLALLGIERINNGITIKEDQDLFGERFFCDLSHLLSEARQFSHLGDYNYMKGIDIKNSQFYFLSQLCNKSVIDEYLIKREKDPILKKQFKRFKNDLYRLKNEADFQLLNYRIKNGTLYDHLADELDITRKVAKNKYFFKGVFSKVDINLKAKNVIKKHYPSLFELIELTNSLQTPKLFPMLLQKVESRILLDEVAVELFTELNKLETKHPFFTVHDAFYVHPDVYDLSIDIIEKSFLKLGLEIPKLGD